jgi:hypothetical protein
VTAWPFCGFSSFKFFAEAPGEPLVCGDEPDN